MSKHPLYSDRRLLLTDLDSTVIFSHRHAHDESCVWVEKIGEKLQSFMTAESYRFYKEQHWLQVVPLTTRNHEPYARLQEMTRTLGWTHALICNGSILLDGENENPDWRTESERLVSPYLPELLRLKTIAENAAGTEFVRYSEPFMFYVRGENADAAYEALSAAADPADFIIHRYTRKTYCIPQVFNKGASAERYAREFGFDGFFAAGDSAFDLPMLERAAVGFCPEALCTEAHPGGQLIGCAEPFADEVCKHLQMLEGKGIHV